ncbi:MAG: T9SS type A sorting domain-containing protein [Taibaiella sp.]|nr:T9SS type A sorting domain-containing protein [Taibaiella sp.]
MNICLSLIMLLSATGLKAQQEGYSKTYSYRGDTLRRFDYTGTNFLYNPISGSIIFPYYSGNYQYRFLNQWLNLDAYGSIRYQITEEIPNTTYYNYAVAYAFNSDSEFYSAGGYKTYGDTFSTLFLQKKDTLLNTIWRKEYNLPFNGHIWHILSLDEQSILLQAVINRDSISPQYPVSHSKVDLIKTDTAGNLLWHRVVDSSEWNIVTDIIKAHDGNLILCGRTWGYGVTDGGAFVMKVDTAGNKLWHQVYDLPGYDGLEKMIATSEGNYICVGWGAIAPEISDMQNGVGRVIKIDEQGDIIWNKIINISPRNESFRTVTEASNGDIVAFGSTYKYYAYDQYGYEVGNTRGPDGWALRLDTQGNEVWNRVFGHNAVDNCHDYLYNAMALPDGSFIATGSTNIPDTFYYEGQQIASKRQSAWVVKLNSDGCMNSDCPGTLGSGKEMLKKESVSLFPNPGNGTINISYTKPFNAEAQLIVYDQLGRIVQQQLIPKNIQQYTFSLNSQATGLYYILLQSGKENYSFKYILNSE